MQITNNFHEVSTDITKGLAPISEKATIPTTKFAMSGWSRVNFTKELSKGNTLSCMAFPVLEYIPKEIVLEIFKSSDLETKAMLLRTCKIIESFISPKERILIGRVNYLVRELMKVDNSFGSNKSFWPISQEFHETRKSNLQTLWFAAIKKQTNVILKNIQSKEQGFFLVLEFNICKVAIAMDELSNKRQWNDDKIKNVCKAVGYSAKKDIYTKRLENFL